MSRRPFTLLVYPQPPGLSTENGFAEVFCTNTYNKSSLNPLLWRGLKHGNKYKRTFGASPVGANRPSPAHRVQPKLDKNRHGGERRAGDGGGGPKSSAATPATAAHSRSRWAFSHSLLSSQPNQQTPEMPRLSPSAAAARPAVP